MTINNGNDPLRNAQDPLLKAGPEAERELFRRFSIAASGFPTDVAIGAAINVLINAIRMGTPDWSKAEKVFDDYFGRAKQIMKSHYDSTGRKKGIFPYNQIVMPPFHQDDDKPYHK